MIEEDYSPDLEVSVDGLGYTRSKEMRSPFHEESKISEVLNVAVALIFLKSLNQRKYINSFIKL